MWFDWSVTLGSLVNVLAILSFLFTAHRHYKSYIEKMAAMEEKVSRMHKTLMGGNGNIEDTLVWRISKIENELNSLDCRRIGRDRDG